MKIIQASISENGTIKGNAGDQTGKELNIKEWYKRPWEAVIRYENSIKANEAMENAKYLADSNLVGYSQPDRNNLYKALKKYNFNIEKYIASGEKTNCDCSSFVYACYACVLPELRMDTNAPTTSNYIDFFGDKGFYIFQNNTYTNQTSLLINGDILLSIGKHVVIAYNDSYSNSIENALSVIASEVLKGTFGNGVNRKENIYKAVQNKVNKLLS
jgi:hypothetical protein